MTRRTPALEEALLTGIAEGSTMRRLCNLHGLHRCTVYFWMKDEDFAARMAWARAIGFDAIAEEALEIADDASNDAPAPPAAAGKPGAPKGGSPKGRSPKGGAPKSRRDSGSGLVTIARARLRINTRLQLLSHWDPKRYRDVPQRFEGMAGVAAMIGRVGGTGMTEIVPADPDAIAARLASLLAIIAARDAEDKDEATIEHRDKDPQGDSGDDQD
ncbi:MAG: hypothetical protein JWN66_1531 [Sphingomonas bacterium]|uniref:terminase small subunit-like protein n=1 Tax=Sphingomonas bacterium TaxID=1895847 RepID=UPI00261A4D98|nr:hypothetical protein [Sphingomonas bacterium]MDB5704415.1 hypothetical protein [Sphingomonas bacterium]